MNIGDFDLDSTFDFQFTTTVGGEPTTLVGGALSVYEGQNTTEITAGLTLTTDFDSQTGTHNVHVVATAGNGYATAKNYTIWLSAGTVGGTTVAPRTIAVFSIENRSVAAPDTIATALLDLADGVEVGLTLRQALRLIVAAEAGKVSGGGSTPVIIRNAVADDKERITATVDLNGNRTAVVVDLS